MVRGNRMNGRSGANTAGEFHPIEAACDSSGSLDRFYAPPLGDFA